MRNILCALLVFVSACGEVTNPEGMEDDVVTIPEDAPTMTDTDSDVGDDSSDETVQTSSYVWTSDLPYIYFLDDDGQRHAFVEEMQYYTWEDTLELVTEISASEMMVIELGRNMPVKPGIVLVKIVSDPSVFWVEATDDPYAPELRRILDDQTAEEMIGSDWFDYVINVPEWAFVDYGFGDPIEHADDIEVDLSVMKKREDLHE